MQDGGNRSAIFGRAAAHKPDESVLSRAEICGLEFATVDGEKLSGRTNTDPLRFVGASDLNYYSGWRDVKDRTGQRWERRVFVTAIGYRKYTLGRDRRARDCQQG